MALAVGARLGPYEVIAPLGAGGMGEVYRARDTRLGREVAIKVLPDNVARDPDRLRRFEEEARAVAALNHPHICQLYDVGAGFLVLEYVDGGPLRGPMTLDKVLTVASQIASALEAAHARGILHRDLKPANILVTRAGSTKLLDFGLARVVTSDADITRTTEGSVLGTAAYMSPEQAQGKAVDARSDIFSFGAVLYELISGRRAFEGTSTADVISAVLRDDPPSLDTEPAIARVVERCLAKNLDARFQTIGDMKAALDQVPLTTVKRRPSIAVLPFANLSADKENEYFSDGLADEIINALAHVPGLRVTARTSSFAFRGKEQDVRRMAETLDVGAVLEGSVRRSGNRVRVTAQLINAADGYHLWSERYDRELTDVFAVQDEIASAVTGALQAALSGALIRHETPVLPAYEAYLKGRHLARQRTGDSLTRAQMFFQQAIALAPDFVAAHVGLGECLSSLATEGQRLPRDVMPLAKAEAQAALALNPSDVDARALFGAVAAIYEYDWALAQRIWNTLGTRLDHANLVTLGISCLSAQGRLHEIPALLERAIEHDPLNELWRSILAFFLMLRGETDRALAEVRKIFEFNPGSWVPYFAMTGVYAITGRLDEALTAAERAYGAASWHPRVAGIYAGVLTRRGERQRADEVLRQLRETPDSVGVPMGMIQYHFISGEIEGAIDWFERAVEQREPLAPIYARNPVTERLRSSPRWTALMRAMNLPDVS